MKLRNLLVSLFMIISLSGSIVGGLLYSFSTSAIAENNTGQSLLAVAKSRAEHISTYFNDEIEKIKLTSSRTQLKIDVENYLKAPSPVLKGTIRIKLNDSKNSVAEYRHVCFVDLDGTVVTCDDWHIRV